MANIIHTIITTIATLKIPPRLYIRAITTVLIPELREINLSGLKVLRSLNILMTGKFTSVRAASMIDVKTMKKSN